MAAPKKQILTPVEDETSKFTNLARSFLGQGTALGFGDEIEAYVRSKINDSKSYDELLTEPTLDPLKLISVMLEKYALYPQLALTTVGLLNPVIGLIVFAL